LTEKLEGVKTDFSSMTTKITVCKQLQNISGLIFEQSNRSHLVARLGSGGQLTIKQIHAQQL
jgi:hypothetical protein